MTTQGTGPDNAIRGVRRATPNTVAAACAGAGFDGLPDGSTRSDLLRVLHRGGMACGLLRHEIARLAYLVGHTLEIDWQEGGRPLVWVPVGRQAEELGLSRRRIAQVERDLAEKGWISHRDAVDRGRRGCRDPVTGHVKQAFGVDLAPLGVRFTELAAAADAAAALRERRETLRSELLALRMEIRCLQAALGRKGEGDGEPVVAPRLMTAEEMAGAVERLRDRRDRLRAEVAGPPDDGGGGGDQGGGVEHPGVDESATAEGEGDSGGGVPPESCRGEAARHRRNRAAAGEEPVAGGGALRAAPGGEAAASPILIQIQDSVNFVGNRPESSTGAAAARASAVPVDVTADTARADDGPGWGAGPGPRHDRDAERLLALEAGDPAWRDLMDSGALRRLRLGIRPDTWVRAVEAMGARAAAVTVAVIDMRRREGVFAGSPDYVLTVCGARAVQDHGGGDADWRAVARTAIVCIEDLWECAAGAGEEAPGRDDAAGPRRDGRVERRRPGRGAGGGSPPLAARGGGRRCRDAVGDSAVRATGRVIPDAGSGEGPATGAGSGPIHDCGVEHLQPGRVASVGSQRLQELAGGDPGWRDLVQAATVRRGDLGIHHDTWRTAVRVMGARAAAVTVAVIDGRRLDRGTFVWCPDRFLAACGARAGRGELHLHRSVWGLETAQRFREAWNVWDEVSEAVQGRLLRGESRQRIMAAPA